MNWNSTAEFLAMGGYGFYVWGSFAVTAACLALEPFLLAARLKRARQAATNPRIRNETTS